MDQNETKELAELRRELMALQADYVDLQKKLFRWSERFFEFYKLVDSVNEIKET